jgi:peptide/nickel transport system ATP-binding protein
MSHADEDAVVDLQDIEVHFEDSDLLGLGESEIVKAVDGVSLSIPENDIVALVGESGCGKTTLGKTAVGLQRPTGGRVLYRGQDFWKTNDGRGFASRLRGEEAEGPYTFQDMRRALQIIHQDPGDSLNANYTVMSLLSDPLKRWNPELSEQDRRTRILGFLEFVGMTPPEDYAGRYPHQLSGGEQQRVALIRALLMNPDLILADEAISALDVSLRVEMMELLLELQDQFNTSYLFISHDISNARYLTKKADGRIGIMYLGELVEIGPVDEIVEDPQHPYTEVLLWATPDLESQETVEDPPVRALDIPDPSNPPSGCRFHTRCPEAREVCRTTAPEAVSVGENHEVACFRVYDEDHEYWSSEPLGDADAEAEPESESGDQSTAAGD